MPPSTLYALHMLDIPASGQGAKKIYIYFQKRDSPSTERFKLLPEAKDFWAL
jgi:hypothetical protein